MALCCRTEDWLGDGVAFQHSYYAAILRKSQRYCCHLGYILPRVPALSLRTGAGQRASNGHAKYGMYVVPRAATGWPPTSGGHQRHIKDGLFRKIMNLIGQGAAAIKYFIFVSAFSDAGCSSVYL